MNDATAIDGRTPEQIAAIATRAGERTHVSVLGIIPFKRYYLIVYHRRDFDAVGVVALKLGPLAIASTDQALEDHIRDRIRDNAHETEL